MRPLPCCAALLAVLLPLLQAAPAAAQHQRQPAPAGAVNVSLRTGDGWTLAGWYYAPRRASTKRPAPAVLLLHQRGRDKSGWGALPEALLAEDYAVLAVDLRGHGETLAPDGQLRSVASLTDDDYRAMLEDVSAAHNWLAAQKNVAPERLAIVGASIGANLGLIYAAADKRVRTVICLSAGLDYHSLKPARYLDAYGRRPVYLVAARGDLDALQAAQELAAGAKLSKPASVRLFDGTEHGTDLLAAHPGLENTIASGWLLNYMPPVR